MQHRRALCLALALIALLAGFAAADQVWPKTAAGPAGSVDGPFTFAVLGDNRPSRSGGPVPAVYGVILRSINDTDASLVINTGDIIMGSPEVAAAEAELGSFVAATEMLDAPCFVAYGNHELRGPEHLELLERRIGPSYYAFSYGNSRLYVLNTYVPDEEGRITGEQLAWLRGDLAGEGAAAAHRFVFFHAPMFSPMNDAGKRDWGDPANRDELQQLFTKSKVDAVFNGHDHYFAWRMVDGVQHIVTGGGGAPLYRVPGALSINHFMLVHVDGDGVSIRLVPVEAPQEAGPPPAGEVILARGSTGWRVSEAFPTEAPPDRDGVKWYQPGYPTDDWKPAGLPFGYKRGAEVKFATELAINGGDYYAVGSFDAPEDVAGKRLRLLVNSDNGAVIYINGVLVDEDPAALSGAGHNPEYWNRTADIPAGVVRPGANHIAARVANNEGSSDAYLDLEIAAIE